MSDARRGGNAIGSTHDRAIPSSERTLRVNRHTPAALELLDCKAFEENLFFFRQMNPGHWGVKKGHKGSLFLLNAVQVSEKFPNLLQMKAFHINNSSYDFVLELKRNKL